MKYWAVTCAAFLVAMAVAWTPLATSIDNSAYDWMMRLYPHNPGPLDVVVVAIDETTLSKSGGMRSLRTTLAETLTKVAKARPRTVAIDFTLTDRGDPVEDSRLAEAMHGVPNLILATDIAQDGSGWQDPLPEFVAAAKALGHVHADPDPVCRQIPLEKAVNGVRRWALALEAARPGTRWTEDPRGIESASDRIPAPRSTGRNLRIDYVERIPTVSASDIDTARLNDKVVFIGATALTAARDRLMTPLGRVMPGVEIHAQLFQTLQFRRFRTDVSPTLQLVVCLLTGLAATTIFARLSAWPAYSLGALLILGAHAIPHIAFQMDVVFPTVAPMLTAWLTVVTAAAYQYFAQRRQLHRAEADKSRYQQAIQFVTHEMRTPLTAIQGSSELMGRYNLSDDKRKQMTEMIHSESKRLGSMIQTFLDIERLTDGRAELKREAFAADALIDACVARARPLADRKRQTIRVETQASRLDGDRELLEYAVYNLLTNAIKYSPEGTEVVIEARQDGAHLHIAVRDHGMGMDAKEIEQLGRKFYRTKRAEESGIVGTGIGLSIVQQILTHHEGRLEVSSAPGKGSCFTMVLPAQVSERTQH